MAGSDCKKPACNARDSASIPVSGRSPGEGNGYAFQYSSLENSMDRGACRATVHEVCMSWTQLSDFHMCIYYLHIWHLPRNIKL